MAQVQKPSTVYVVQLTEYERGWGQRHWDTWYFDNEQEARNAATEYNQKYNNLTEAPDWYVRADYVGSR